MEVLQNYSTAELIAILIAVFAGVKGLYEGVMWILDRLNIYHNVRSKNEKLEQGKNLGTIKSFAYIAKEIKQWFSI